MRVSKVPTIEGSYDEIIAYNPNEFPWDKVNHNTFKARKKKQAKTYCESFGAFDIESTTIIPKIIGYQGARKVPIYERDPYAFMYHWQMCIDGICVYGRYWHEWIDFLTKLVQELQVSPENKFIIYIHNLSYEYQFMHNFLEQAFGSLEIFARSSRKPMKVSCANGLEFRCSYILSNMSLYKATINELGVQHIKAKGDLDYKVLRYPNTQLNDIEFSYCIGDVISLWEFIKCRLNNENDNLELIPLTSTGYVRRDVRKATKKDNKYRYYFQKLRIKPEVYIMMKEAGRGGNTHACRWLSGRIYQNVYSFDEQSAYPAVQVLYPEFPISKFMKWGDVHSKEEFEEILKEYACLFRIQFVNLRLKKRVPMPYIPISKEIIKTINPKLDNGRVLSADSYCCTLTNIDFRIIEQQYEWDSIYISDMHVARKGFLPQVIRDKVLSYFKDKSLLKFNIQKLEDMERMKNVLDLNQKEELSNLLYLYMKSKNRLNGIFGMTYSDIVFGETFINAEGKWEEQRPDTIEEIQEAIDKYYDNKNSFLYYGWGLFTTALARMHLQKLIDVTSDLKYGAECIYCDTDSSKCINPPLDIIEQMNQDIIARCEELGAYAEVNGKKYYLGIYENEYDEPMKEFITLGAKKYAYTDKHGLHTTISGVSKSQKEMTDIKDFKTGFTFHESAGSTLYYNDDNSIYPITMNGITFETSSNIGMIDSTYTIGITGEYAELIGYNISTIV